jgi:signal transduction histidine kinase
MRGTFRAKLLWATLGLVVVAEGSTVVALDRALAAMLQDQLARRLEDQANGALEWVAQGRHPDVVAGRLAAITAARVTLFDARGAVLGDSDEAAAIDDVAAAPEIVAARAGLAGRDARFDARVGDDVLFVAVAERGGVGVRLATPLADVERTIALVRRRLLATSLLVFALAVVVAMVVARLLARPLVAMRDAAQAIARGRYDTAAVVDDGARDELGDLQRSLKSLSTQLQATEQRRREFVGDISHEIGTPVAAIQGYSETLLSADVDDATRAEFVGVIHRHAGRIARLVDDLRFLSTAESRPSEARRREPVRVVDVARHVQRALQPRAVDASARVDVDVGDDVAVLGDPDHVERVLLNLVDNAVKYARGAIAVRAQRQGERIVIDVDDDGPGIAAEHLPRLFERFYRVDAGRSREAGGTGLGLAIVRRLVDDMGGSVDVTSEVGRGTRFVVVLPAA